MNQDGNFPILWLGSYKIQRISGEMPALLIRECGECKVTMAGKPTMLITRDDIRIGVECPNCGIDNPLLRGKVTEIKCGQSTSLVSTLPDF